MAIHALFAGLSLALIGAVLFDCFETMILPRPVTRKLRPVRVFYRFLWSAWRSGARWFRQRQRREVFLSLFGPLSVLLLFMTWAALLMVGFGTLHWSSGTVLRPAVERSPLGSYLYLSGTTFFTLGYGDVTPVDALGRLLAVIESGMGFGFMAVVIGYLPVLYQAYAIRERTIGLLDARAGSPPTAGEFLTRLADAGRWDAAQDFEREWEGWSADLLDNQLAFPVLAYYRSQHANQSWVTTLAFILDTSALLLVDDRKPDRYQYRLTFAMARHAAVDLSLIFWVPPRPPAIDRLPRDRLAELLKLLAPDGEPPRDLDAADITLSELRAMYEPFLIGLSEYFELPAMMPEKAVVDNWQTSAWLKRTPGISSLPGKETEHFG
jgi:hypothetical protein